jgi:putative flippase GtrA
LAGVSTVPLNYALSYFMVSLVHISYLLAAGISFMAASACNYCLSVRYVFIPGGYGKSFEIGMFL